MNIGKIIRRSVVAWFKDGAPSMGAAIAFYALFAIAPILLIVIWGVGAFVSPNLVQAHVLEQMRGPLGDSGLAAVHALIVSVQYSALSGYSTAVGVAAVLISASSVFAELQNALNRIWRSPPRSTAEGLRSAIRARVISFGMILLMGTLLLVSLIAAAALQALGAWLAGYVADWRGVLLVLNAMFGFLLSTVLFAVIYKYVPDDKFPWRDVWVGALVTSMLYAVGKLLIVTMLGSVARSSAYGLAGSFLVLMLWVYYSAQIFLLGAEFTCTFAYAYGSRVGRTLGEAPG